jgi:Uncharacterized protein, possibly involved in utilization of glycolate and propanediol
MAVLTLEIANQIVFEARKYARSIDAAPICIAVLDIRGVVIVLQTEDGCALLRPDIAQGKAWSNLGMGASTRSMRSAFEELPNMNPAFHSFMHLAGGRLVPSPGGVFIMDGEETIGAIGVSGDRPDIDEACAIAGIEAAGFTARI